MTMISNGPAMTPTPPRGAQALCVILDRAEELKKKNNQATLIFQGRKLANYFDVPKVLGSLSRKPGTIAALYKDHVGRLTLEPLGEAVGALLTGGLTPHESCYIGLYEEVKRAPDH